MDIQTKIKLFKSTIDSLNDDHDIDAYLKHVCHVEDLKDLIKALNQHDRVLFAYRVAKSVCHFIEHVTEVFEKVNQCFDLLDKWLDNPDSVSKGEFYNVTDIIYVACDGNKKLNATTFYAKRAAVYTVTSAVSTARIATTDNLFLYDVVANYADNVANYAIEANPDKNQQKLINLRILAGLL